MTNSNLGPVSVGDWMVAPGTTTNTTTHPQWVPVRVDATLAQPIVGVPKDPMHLDGPLSWAAYLTACEQGLALPPILDWAHDFHLPLATWTAPCTRPDPDPRLLAADNHQVWGWACSAAHYTVVRHDVTHIRRKPALEEMVWWTGAARHHIGLGPRRAANVPHQSAWVNGLTWWALANPNQLRTLLGRLTNVGRLARHGWGQLLQVTVTEDADAATHWRRRHFPNPNGSPATIRAPYWHASRRMLCSSTPPA